MLHIVKIKDLPMPKSLESMTFDELMEVSNKLIERLKNSDEDLSLQVSALQSEMKIRINEQRENI